MEIAQTALRAQEDRDTALRQRDELRAVLAPLLDDPYTYNAGRRLWHCRFCRSPEGSSHDPICPVLRRDVLLGRLDDAAPGAARPPEEGA